MLGDRSCSSGVENGGYVPPAAIKGVVFATVFVCVQRRVRDDEQSEWAIPARR